MRLDRDQERAASFTEGRCVVISGPGGGKTRTITERILKLVMEHQVPPDNILALAYTKSASEEMRQRLTPDLKELASRVTLSTIHSFCHQVLRCEGRIFKVISNRDQLVFIRGVLKELKMKNLTVGSVMKEISLAKNNLISVDEFRSLFEGDKKMLSVADIYEHYDREKLKKYLLDFDDLLVETYHLFNSNPDVREKYTSRFQHILLDEYNDTTPIQQEIFKLLVDNASCGASFFCVGDDWQSIFSFTGSSVGNILNFEKTFAPAKVFVLNRNYRSTPQIIKVCQNLIDHNERKIQKTLMTKNPDGEQVIILESSTEENEALSVLNEVEDLVRNQSYQYNQMAILYRAHFQALPIESVLSKHRVPYYIHGGQNFYNRPEIRNLLDYLRVIDDPLSEKGDEALLHILNIPNRYIPRKLMTELREYSAERDMHVFYALKEMRIDLPYVRRNVKQLVTFLEPLIQLSKTLLPAEVINLLRNSLDYDRWITEEDIPAPDDVLVQNLNQFQLSAARHSSIRGFLDYAESFQDESNSDMDGVALMTIHRSKGLEFKCVFLVGMCEGILPSKKGNIEEERRIAFVGMSRAMERLYLSWSHTYLSQPAKKSIFLDEATGVKQIP